MRRAQRFILKLKLLSLDAVSQVSDSFIENVCDLNFEPDTKMASYVEEQSPDSVSTTFFSSTSQNFCCCSRISDNITYLSIKPHIQ